MKHNQYLQGSGIAAAILAAGICAHAGSVMTLEVVGPDVVPVGGCTTLQVRVQFDPVPAPLASVAYQLEAQDAVGGPPNPLPFFGFFVFNDAVWDASPPGSNGYAGSAMDGYPLHLQGRFLVPNGSMPLMGGSEVYLLDTFEILAPAGIPPGEYLINFDNSTTRWPRWTDILTSVHLFNSVQPQPVRITVVPAGAEGCCDDGDCDDGNACTIDGCNNGRCFHVPGPGCGACFQNYPTTSDCQVTTASNCTSGLGTAIFTGAGSNCPQQTKLPACDCNGLVPDPPPAQHLCHCNLPPATLDPQPVPPTPDIPCDYCDPWFTTGDSTLCFNFDDVDAPPIPEDFFATGSKPFSDAICLTGAPLGLTGLGDADTVLRRFADPFTLCDPISPNARTVSIEVIELSLRSIDPITVTIGLQATLWDVSVDLSTVVVPPPGTLWVIKDHCNGGTFVAEFYVQPRFTFTKLSDPSQIRVLDTGASGLPFFTMTSPEPGRWVHNIHPSLGLVSAFDRRSSFHPGFEEHNPAGAGIDLDEDGDADGEDFRLFLAAFGRSVGQPGYRLGADIDHDGTVTVSDYEQWLCGYRCASHAPTTNCQGSLGGGDLAEWGCFFDCFTGPVARLVAECQQFDLEPDVHIDLQDLAVFQAGYPSGR